MTCRLVVVIAFLWLAASTPGRTDDSAVAAASLIPSTDLDSSDSGPRIYGHLPSGVESTLREAYAVALQRVRDAPACRALFETLGDDASTRLRWSLYFTTTAQMELRVCRRGSVAFTYVGSPQTRLCRRFASLGAERAAVTLLHEALHGAGLTERPQDPDGLHPRDIDRMVMQACGFDR